MYIQFNRFELYGYWLNIKLNDDGNNKLYKHVKWLSIACSEKYIDFNLIGPICIWNLLFVFRYILCVKCEKVLDLNILMFILNIRNVIYVIYN